MINLNDIVTAIISKLNQQNNGIYKWASLIQYDREGYPFTTVNISTSYSEEGSAEGEVSYDDSDPLNVIKIRKEQPQITLSFQTYSKDEVESITVCQNTMAFFKETLYDYFANIGIVQVEVTDANNSSGILVVDNEYRYGFDVRFRVESRIENIVERINEVEL